MGRTHQRRNCQLDGCKQGDDAKQRPIPSAAAQDRVGPRHARGIAAEDSFRLWRYSWLFFFFRYLIKRVTETPSTNPRMPASTKPPVFAERMNDP